jgi:hypothetical protein
MLPPQLVSLVSLLRWLECISLARVPVCCVPGAVVAAMGLPLLLLFVDGDGG